VHYRFHLSRMVMIRRDVNRVSDMISANQIRLDWLFLDGICSQSYTIGYEVMD